MIITINNVKSKYQVKNYDYEVLDEDILLYQKEKERIIIMNKTASFIWRLFICHDTDNIELSDEKITMNIIEQFNTDKKSYETILVDIRNLLYVFIDEELICAKI